MIVLKVFVLLLLANLGNDDWSVRERATATLTVLNNSCDIRSTLADAFQESDDVEVKRRLAAILEQYFENLLPVDVADWPSLKQLGVERFSDRWKSLIASVKGVTEESLEESQYWYTTDEESAFAVLLHVRNLLRDGKSRWEVGSLIHEAIQKNRSERDPSCPPD